MTKLSVFDPAMCCSTGVCGPSVDPVMPRFAADLDWLKRQGVEVERYNLAQQPAAFASNPIITAALRGFGNNCLPLILVDGQIVSCGRYPERGELARYAGLDVASADDRPAQASVGSSCCSSSEPAAVVTIGGGVSRSSRRCC